MGSASAGVGSGLPSQAGVTSGWVLQTDGATASWVAVSGGSGVTTMTAVGSSPNANAASISGVNLTMQPADGTHPGVVTTAAQTLAGSKTFPDPAFFSGQITAPLISISAQMGSDFSGVWVGLAYAHAGVGSLFAATDGVDSIFSAPASGSVYIRQAFSTGMAVFSTAGLDLTPTATPAYIKMKSPDGTTYTATIANGGTWSIS